MAVNINIDSQFDVKTEAQWAADATVYSENYGLLISSDSTWPGTDQRRFKIPNGVDTWSNLDYPPVGEADAVSFFKFSHTTTNAILDGSDYFISSGTIMGNTINSSTPMPLPTGKVVEAYISSYNGSTFGTAETMTLTLVDETNTSQGTLSTSVTFDARNRFFKETVDIDITEGRFFIRLDVPTMVTNPTAAKITINLKMEL